MVAVAAATAGACTSVAPPEPTAPAEPPATSTTRVPRIVDESDRPPVTFDPCLDIPDQVLRDAGYDPKSEEVSDFAATHYTFLGCSYQGTLRIPGVLRRYGLNLNSGNITFAEVQEKVAEYATPIEVDGRRALLEVDPSLRRACAVNVETSFGVLIISRVYHPDHGNGVPQGEWCAGLEDTAARISVLIDN
ncbi:hypothetical protein D092_18820 [Rhodococcus ruber Chol-4]|uniref:DUF3558 domain-containing protein n=1 Tax=Rhodococcus TaxID=1827 RepID=UPI000477F7D8|nr:MULTISPECIES: DUF3558 domain-containing protein [Rhodococcus]MDO2378134.1 DUF3558 domain-containing protein [Rhodococcus ruber]MDX5452474.1 DUF3558 domain-containing protein [Rhodococcus sp. (in: high G+C Gram-positive bacteria)]KXF84857.1 hypothetical protein D092_18820 [Rhodococcus ruber Chol-4]MCD2128353.1 DUF3558 domain-containing protein [Rhodococcus ruber]MCZ1071848.1 DUF3558 domain-containing protein [Rhodococcus sp. A5(2022)]